MSSRVRAGSIGGLIGGLMIAALMTTTPSNASIATAVARPAAKPVLSALEKHVEEGDQVVLTARIRSPRTAVRVTLQKRFVSPFSGERTWETVKTVRVNDRAKVKFRTVAVDQNTERYRLSVTYRDASRALVSRPVDVAVWRWIPLKEYPPYYEAQSTATDFGTVAINGLTYPGWGAAWHSHAGVWESRFTPGRHCTSFKAVLGVSDGSDDGSSGSITFTADDAQIYSSPSLTPGMSMPVSVQLDKPYRFGIQLQDTTPGGTTGHDEVESWPVLGEPAFLCTGV